MTRQPMQSHGALSASQACDKATRCALLNGLLRQCGWCCGRKRGRRGCAWRCGVDGGAVDDDFDAAIPLAAFGCVVGCDRIGFAKPFYRDRRCGNAFLREEIAYGAGALLGKLLVVLVAADAIGVALDL